MAENEWFDSLPTQAEIAGHKPPQSRRMSVKVRKQK